VTRSTRRVPQVIEGIAVLHLAVAPLVQPGLAPLVRGGLLDAVGDDRARESAAWYVICGVSLLAHGELVRDVIRRTGRVPLRVGAWLGGLGALVTLLMPASGGWALLAAGGHAAWAATRP
jgi:hypothetical protein